MVGFDWNKNGKHDLFDAYMDIKVIERVNKKIEQNRISHNTYKSSDENCAKENKTQIKPICNTKNDNDGVIIFKSVVSVLLCLLGIMIPVILDLNGIVILLSIFGCLAASIAILKSI